MRIAVRGIVVLALALLGAWGVTSCHNGTTPSDSARDGLTSEIDQAATGTLSADYPIPSLADLTSRLQKAGVGYVIDAGSDPKNANKYVTSTSRAVNLGVYGSDLLYASTYGIKADVSRYLAAVLSLSQELNIHIS